MNIFYTRGVYWTRCTFSINPPRIISSIYTTTANSTASRRNLGPSHCIAQAKPATSEAKPEKEKLELRASRARKNLFLALVSGQLLDFRDKTIYMYIDR